MAENEKQQTRNLCAQIPVDLHARVREEQERSGKTLGEYMTILIQEYYDRKEGVTMGDTRTFAAQIPTELFDEQVSGGAEDQEEGLPHRLHPRKAGRGESGAYCGITTK